MNASSLRRLGTVLLSVAATALLATGCSSSDTAEPAAGQTTATGAAAVTLLSPNDADALIGDERVEIIDVRTPEEFAEGHLEGATLIDFYAADFAERIGELDRDTTYVVYCRSGNRSGQATALMAQQGFTAVNDVDGGVVAWEAAGLPLER